jgi:DNA-binding CsgD family transcriptional regulator
LSSNTPGHHSTTETPSSQTHAVPDADSTAALEAAFRTGQTLYYAGQHLEAFELATALLDRAIRINDERWQARIRISIAVCLADLGSYQASLAEALRAVGTLFDQRDRAQLSRAFNCASLAASRLGQHDDAIALMRAAFRCADGVLDLTPVFLVNLSMLHARAGRVRQSHRLAQFAVHRVRSRELDPRWLAAAQTACAKAALLSGALPAARGAVLEAIRIFKRCGAQRERCSALLVLGEILLNTSELARARRLLRHVAVYAEQRQYHDVLSDARALNAVRSPGTAESSSAEDVVPRGMPGVDPRTRELLLRFELAAQRVEVERLRRALLRQADLWRSGGRMLKGPAGGAQRSPGSAQDRGLPDPLTAREVQIIRSVMSGATNKEIASALSLSAGTVRNHLSTCMQKLQVRNRTELIAKVFADATLLECRSR